MYFELGRLDIVRDGTAAMTALAEELRQPSQLWVATASQAMLALHEGRYAEAEELIPRALALGRGSQETMAEVGYAFQLYTLRREQDRAGEAYDLLARAANDVPARPLFRCARARLAIELERADEGRRLFEELAANDFDVVPRDQEWLLAASLLTDVCKSLNDLPRANVLYNAQLPYSGRVASISTRARPVPSTVPSASSLRCSAATRERLPISRLRSSSTSGPERRHGPPTPASTSPRCSSAAVRTHEEVISSKRRTRPPTCSK